MKIINKNKRQKYSSPKIEKIEIDKDISLQLESAPPIGPSETKYVQPNNSVNPFKIDLG
jgi:hypothetical protein